MYISVSKMMCMYMDMAMPMPTMMYAHLLPARIIQEPFRTH